MRLKEWCIEGFIPWLKVKDAKEELLTRLIKEVDYMTPADAEQINRIVEQIFG